MVIEAVPCKAVSKRDKNDAEVILRLSAYDEHFVKQWQKRWTFLLVDQQLSIQDITDHPALLQVP